MKIYYPYRKGVLRFDCTNKVWEVFYPRKSARAKLTGEVLTQNQVRTILINYSMTGKPIVHRGGA